MTITVTLTERVILAKVVDWEPQNLVLHKVKIILNPLFQNPGRQPQALASQGAFYSRKATEPSPLKLSFWLFTLPCSQSSQLHSSLENKEATILMAWPLLREPALASVEELGPLKSSIQQELLLFHLSGVSLGDSICKAFFIWLEFISASKTHFSLGCLSKTIRANCLTSWLLESANNGWDK